ncbi:MAG: hypothetical protein JXB05_30975 [Myxococcaceae bacterium]|nr:hypothetical protein [Myxococcaceae bacterium]
MPRSYSFDHFQVPSAEPRSRSLRRQDKQHLADSRHALPEHEEGIHYGKSHAATEEILKARAMAPRRPASTAKAGAPQAAPRISRNTTPIGSLPTTEELPPRGRFQDLLEEAQRQLEVLQSGIGDVGKAAMRLASLPLEVIRLAARRLRLVHG